MRGKLPTEGNFVTVSTVVASPASRGSVQLHSSDPFDDPFIDPNFYGSKFDMTVMKEAIYAARRFTAARSWDSYILKPSFNATTEAEIEDMIRDTTWTISHPVGMAAMSAKSADYGVVDPDLRVKGIRSGLRVIDGSVFVS
ncbi:hypothetical protein E1B28_007991 [Marasmius oreades]|uniref:Glucose-methanol-choline oxidoreductase C-terminal domain-containing protein n=1 Tax=Marasmius oreades TaxID=181124 RepID=A0A9P7S2R7_9AGAR|nr:uncharacterized protein E1B28_007991 [Marasmius oreades]KAG7094391.1 hypothetical protein E1B28_007991 [Marasmius oreades]